MGIVSTRFGLVTTAKLIISSARKLEDFVRAVCRGVSDGGIWLNASKAVYILASSDTSCWKLSESKDTPDVAQSYN